VSYPVRGEQPTVVETLRVRVVPEGSHDVLFEFLKLYRDAVQLVVNELWDLDGKLSRKKLHGMFYGKLRKLGLRAHHAKQIYTYAKSIVESARANSGRKPVLRRLSARIDRYDYKLDLDTMSLTLKLHSDNGFRLKLLAPRERVEKYREWSNYELVVKYDDESFWVSVYFKRVVESVKPKTIMAIDLNFDNLTLAVFTLDGRVARLKRFETPLRKILIYRIWIERTQKRYPKSWRFIKGVRNAIERHGERIRNISWDYSHKIGDLIAELALRHRSVVVLEDLEKLRDNAKKGREFNKKLTLWFYRRTQFCIEYESRERGLEVARVNPRGTSSKCPKCGSKLADSGFRILRCSKCNYIGDRDVVATINLYMRFSSNYSRCGGLGVPLNAPEPDENPSGMRGNRDEAMNHINPYKPT
jgi:putative transposase